MKSCIDPDDLVDMIHATPHKGVIVVAGGGSGLFPLLMERGGASATLLYGGIAHGVKSVPEWLGIPYDSPAMPPAVSSEVARGLAMAAFQKAIRLSTDDSPLFGVGCTVSLMKKGGQEREGRKHRLFAAVQTARFTTEIEYVFPGGQNRVDEEDAVDHIVLNLIREGCGIPDQYDTRTPPYDRKTYADSKTCHHSQLPKLLSGKVPFVAFKLNPGAYPTEYEGPFVPSGLTILSTSLNPLHPGHVEMKRQATNLICRPTCLELTVRNAAKPPLDYIEIERRLSRLALQDQEGILLLSNAATFGEKSEVFKKSTFAIGYDTAVRIDDPKYYASIRDRDHAYATMSQNEAYFLVFGRVDSDGVFRNIDPDDPKSFPDKESHRFWSVRSSKVGENDFRNDISSTALRSVESTNVPSGT